MPAGIGYPGQGLPPEAMMAGMDAMLGGAPGGPMSPQGATEPTSSEADVVAQLALENVQMRQLLGLGPDDPIPVPDAAPAAPPVPGPPGMM